MSTAERKRASAPLSAAMKHVLDRLGKGDVLYYSTSLHTHGMIWFKSDHERVKTVTAQALYERGLIKYRPSFPRGTVVLV